MWIESGGIPQKKDTYMSELLEEDTNVWTDRVKLVISDRP